MSKYPFRSNALRSWLKATTALAGALPILGLTISLAHANPQGGVVAQGAATITQTDAKTVTINQSTDRAVLNWQSFSIAVGETTRFVQPSSSSMTLNRVTGDQVSQILGNLQANGRVVLVNPNGIVFGADSKIDVAALVASTANIKDSNFMAGNLRFDIPGKANAQIINQGTITAADGGLVALVSPSLRNSGIISARLGKVALAAANGVTLDLYGDNLILFQASDKITSQVVGTDGQPVSSLIENTGKIYADGGRVLMTANAAKGVVDSAINTTGLISARTVEQQGGEIVLKGEGGGSVQVAGTLDASAPASGNGGFIETSGERVTVAPSTRITTNALFGRAGRWLIDPTNYTVASSGGDITGTALAAYLALNNVEIQTATTGTGNGDIFVNDAVTWSSLNKLTLTAYRNINVNAFINATGGGSVRLRSDSQGSGGGTVTFAGPGSVFATNGATINLFYNPVSYADGGTKSDTLGNPYTTKISVTSGATFTPYMLVNNINQLQAMEGNLRGYYGIGKDIDASATSSWNGGLGFAPIGSMSTPFLGILYGNERSINNLYINRPDDNYVGLFARTYNASIDSLAFNGGQIVGRARVGALAGSAEGSTYGSNENTSYNTTISNINSNASISGSAIVGGIAGDSDGVNFLYIGSSATITSHLDNSNSTPTWYGGIIGHGNYISIKDSYFSGSVSAPAYVGGLGGEIALATIKNVYSSGSVSGTYSVSRLANTTIWASIANAYWRSDASGPDTIWGGFGASNNSNTAPLSSVASAQASSYHGFDFSESGPWMMSSNGPALRPVSERRTSAQNNSTTSSNNQNISNSDLNGEVHTGQSWLPNNNEILSRHGEHQPAEWGAQSQAISDGVNKLSAFTGLSSSEISEKLFGARNSADSVIQNVQSFMSGFPDINIGGSLSLSQYLSNFASIAILDRSFNSLNSIPIYDLHPLGSESLGGGTWQQVKINIVNAKSEYIAASNQSGKSAGEKLVDSFIDSTKMVIDSTSAAIAISKNVSPIGRALDEALSNAGVYSNWVVAGVVLSKIPPNETFGGIRLALGGASKALAEFTSSGFSSGNVNAGAVSNYLSALSDMTEGLRPFVKLAAADSSLLSKVGFMADAIKAYDSATKAVAIQDAMSKIDTLPEEIFPASQKEVLKSYLDIQFKLAASDAAIAATKIAGNVIHNASIVEAANKADEVRDIISAFAGTSIRNQERSFEDSNQRMNNVKPHIQTALLDFSEGMKGYVIDTVQSGANLSTLGPPLTEVPASWVLSASPPPDMGSTPIRNEGSTHP